MTDDGLDELQSRLREERMDMMRIRKQFLGDPTAELQRQLGDAQAALKQTEIQIRTFKIG